MEIIGNYKQNKAVKLTTERMMQLDQLLLKCFSTLSYSCKVENGSTVTFQSLEEMLNCDDFKLGRMQPLTIYGTKDDDATTLAVYIDSGVKKIIDFKRPVNVKYVFNSDVQKSEVIKELNRFLKKSRARPAFTKTGKILLALLVLVICVLSYLFKPMSFDEGLFTSNGVAIVYYEPRLAFDENGARPDPKITEFNFERESLEYQQIEEVLNKYFYHICIDTLTNGNSLHGGGDSYDIYFENGSITIHDGVPYIFVDGTVYRVGYFGTSKTTALNNDLDEILGIEKSEQA